MKYENRWGIHKHYALVLWTESKRLHIIIIIIIIIIIVVGIAGTPYFKQLTMNQSHTEQQ